jgi:NAD+ synthase
MKDKIVSGLKDFFEKTGKKKAVVGLSGGIDSAVTLFLGVLALGKENVTAIFMPEEGLTDEKNKDDAIGFAESLGVDMIIKPINNFLDVAIFPWQPTPIAEMNLKPRIRMMILYHFANSNDAIVLGTSNKSEIYLGYGTKYGDCASDVMPIADVLKTEIFELGKELEIPKEIIEKKPSAELHHGQTDEEEMGITYETADKIIRDYLSNVDEKTLKEKYGKDAETVLSRMKVHEHKRVGVPIISAR